MKFVVCGIFDVISFFFWAETPVRPRVPPVGRARYYTLPAWPAFSRSPAIPSVSCAGSSTLTYSHARASMSGAQTHQRTRAVRELLGRSTEHATGGETSIVRRKRYCNSSSIKSVVQPDMHQCQSRKTKEGGGRGVHMHMVSRDEHRNQIHSHEQ